MALKLGSNFDKTKATKNLVRGFKLVPHIDRWLPSWDETGFVYTSARKEPDDAWHPSSHCTPSVYDLWWHAVEGHKEPRKLQPSSVKNFQVGHFWHQFLQWIVVEQLGFATWEAVERKGVRGWGDHFELTPSKGSIRHQPWHWVTGSGDISPVEIPKKGEYLIDFKTMRGGDFNSEVPMSIKKWECQVNIYMDFFDLERAIIVGINKDGGHDMKEFEFRRNQPLIDALYDKWELVSACLDEEVEPDPDYKPDLPLAGMVL